MTKYPTFAGWSPSSDDFPYDQNIYKNEGFKLVGRYDKDDPDCLKLVNELASMGQIIKQIDILNNRVDVWRK